MRPISVLDQHTIDKIAAGEVIERPASVVKELVENAIDAGALSITAEIAEGGKKLIRITDNGSGIEASQVSAAFLSHATSKIEKAEDLETVTSLGFRGEALSSIAAVSQVELITKTPTALSGTRYVIEGGKEQLLEEIGAPDGTTFIVRNLFYNTPARKKFLKTDTAEAVEISSLMEQLALSHPEISFKYIQGNQVRLYTSGTGKVKDVIYNVYGKEVTRSLLELHYRNEFMEISGFAGKPEISRGNRSFENYYVNGRYLRSQILSKGIEDAYKGFLMQHRFPFVLLDIRMDGEAVDVNVHPRKLEVRFSRAPEVYEAVVEAVRGALTRKEMIPEVSAGKEEKRSSTKPAPISRGAAPEPFEKKTVSSPSLGGDVPASHLTVLEISEEREPAAAEKKRKEPPAPDFAPEVPSVTYEASSGWGGSAADHNFRGDSTAAGSREDVSPYGLEEAQVQGPALSRAEESLFEGSLSGLETDRETAQETDRETAQDADRETAQDMDQQTAQITEPVSSSPRQQDLFEERFLDPASRSRHRLIGQLFGTYWLVEFGERFFIIDQHAAHEKIFYERLVREFQKETPSSQLLLPPILVSLTMEEEQRLQENRELLENAGFEIEPYGGREYCIRAVPANLYGFEIRDLFRQILDQTPGARNADRTELFARKLASMACKAAVKGNHTMSMQEADQMIDELLCLEEPYHCPHGRPTMIEMTKTDMEKKFHRIV